MKKCIVLCADDYGQAPAVSKGIITLIQYGRLSATSCLVNFSTWKEQATWLKPYRSQVDIGLHFNLTEGRPLSAAYRRAHGDWFQPLSVVLRQAFLGKLNAQAIEAECLAQLDEFVKATGFLPDFLDGHQHVHQFPIVRQALLNSYEKRLGSTKAYIRVVHEQVKFHQLFKDFKKFIILATGTRALKQLVQEKNIPNNTTFAGVYPFKSSASYASLFPQFLSQVDNGGLIMCHPGFGADKDSLTDPIAASRLHEYRYLFSGQFLEDCLDHDVMIRRFHACFNKEKTSAPS